MPDADSIALMSDVHGNLPAAEAVLADVSELRIDRVYCLGDLIGYGPDPGPVIDLIQAAGIQTVLGNYDEGIAWDKGSCGCYYADAEARRIGELSYLFTSSAVSMAHKGYLRSLPRELHVPLADKTVHLVHGSPRRINEYLSLDRDERTYVRLAAAETAQVLAFGHTHIPWHRCYADVLFVNVGSVGRPKDGDPRACYTILHSHREGTVEVDTRRVPYDVELVARRIMAAGLPAELAEALRQDH